MRKQILVAAALSMLAMIVLALPASAGRSWCSRDPIVRINGTDVQIWVSIPEEYVFAVNGPIEVKVYTPVGATTELVYTDSGFNGYGEVVKFSTSDDLYTSPDGSFDILVKAYVPFDAKALRTVKARANDVPIQVSYTANGQLSMSKDGSMTIDGGETTVVEMLNSNTKVTYQITAQ
jgi:hypothetical protein